MASIVIDKYRRSDGTPVKTHKRKISRSLRLKVSKDFFKKDGDDFSDREISYPKKNSDADFDFTKIKRNERIKARVNSNSKKGKKHLKGQAKVEVVMKEFKKGKLRSSSGKKVTKRPQAIAIAMSEAGLSKSNPKDNPKRKLTLRKAKAFSKEEKSASKEYKDFGFKKIAKDEKRHHEFFEKEAKELGRK